MASLMAERGYSPAQIAAHLGHADGGVLALRTYVHAELRPPWTSLTRRWAGSNAVVREAVLVLAGVVLASGIGFAAIKGWQALLGDRRLWGPTRFSDLSPAWRVFLVVLVALGLVAGLWLGKQVSEGRERHFEQRRDGASVGVPRGEHRGEHPHRICPMPPRTFKPPTQGPSERHGICPNTAGRFS
jgi:hypothetical protein